MTSVALMNNMLLKGKTPTSAGIKESMSLWKFQGSLIKTMFHNFVMLIWKLCLKLKFSSAKLGPLLKFNS